MTRRVLFYVQHLLGVGHLKRAELLAQAMTSTGLEVIIALGGPPLAEVPFARTQIEPLPPASIAGEDFSTLLDASGRPVDEAWKSERRAALFDLWRRTDPDVVLLELFPFGRRQFRFEIIPLLETVHASPRPPRVACSVRDVLVQAKRPEREAEAVATVRRYFDQVLVHGDPELIPFERTFSRAAEIADRLAYTGYIADDRDERPEQEGAGEVLVSAGGGAVGGPLLRVALAARPLTQFATSPWRLLTGPNLAEKEFRQLRDIAGQNAVVERFRDDFPQRLRAAALSVSQAGYNTTMDILRAGVRAVVVPYETPGETEQRLRAELLAERGLLQVVPAGELSPERLAAAIAVFPPDPTASAPRIALDGARRGAALIARLAAERETSPPCGARLPA
jgi:predicted glycosyltransferase